MSTHPEEPPYDAELMAAVTDLGEALRGLVDASVRTDVPAADLRAAAAGARELTERLAASRRPAGHLSPLDDVLAFRQVFNMVSGVGSALAPPVVLRVVDGGVIAETVFGLAYEGPPGYLHGGMSGLVMDQVLGGAAIHAGLWGMTARLELDYRGPVPLDTPVVLAARVGESAGRKTIVTGSIALAATPDRPLVEARGVFVTPRTETVDSYFAGVTDGSGRHTQPGRKPVQIRPTDATAPVVAP
ncbi:PaaI family thioesterase [Trujillonella endophytica]|uniref:Thioesterase superfamily protein n=1 Tax=Trujillonella endophytica TaxID=673521 RepID=A0A1H8WHH2_9ACTN|nr:PaaI family thioesterase [Trujillella endophytica]SEP26548.1 Thioesterase superfamily protein [Trujillella endophytica]